MNEKNGSALGPLSTCAGVFTAHAVARATRARTLGMILENYTNNLISSDWYDLQIKP